MGSKINMKSNKIGGYYLTKKILIDLLVFLGRQVIPIFGSVIVMSVVCGVLLWLVKLGVLVLPFLAILALVILLGVSQLISKMIFKLTKGKLESLYGKQELYLIDDVLYYTVEIRSRFLHEIRCFKLIEVYETKKSKFSWRLDCLCYKIKKYNTAKESVEVVLEKLRQTDEHLKATREPLAIKRYYSRQSEQLIEDVLKKYNTKFLEVASEENRCAI